MWATSFVVPQTLANNLLSDHEMTIRPQKYPDYFLTLSEQNLLWSTKLSNTAMSPTVTCDEMTCFAFHVISQVVKQLQTCSRKHLYYLYRAPKQERQTFEILQIIWYSPPIILLTHRNDINHRYLHVKGLHCEFHILYILAILKNRLCDVTDNI